MTWGGGNPRAKGMGAESSGMVRASRRKGLVGMAYPAAPTGVQLGPVPATLPVWLSPSVPGPPAPPPAAKHSWLHSTLGRQISLAEGEGKYLESFVHKVNPNSHGQIPARDSLDG